MPPTIFRVFGSPLNSLPKAERAANRKVRALAAQARNLAPDCAMAYLVESELEDQRANLGWIEDPAKGLLLAERAARQALTLNDPGANARAHAPRGRIHVIRGCGRNRASDLQRSA